MMPAGGVLAAAILTTTLLIAQTRSQDFGVHNFTSEWVVVMENSSYTPLVADYKNRLVFVSFPNDTSIKLETSMFKNRPCSVQTKFDKGSSSDMYAPLNAVALENGKLVVTFAVAKKSGEEPAAAALGAANETDVWLYAIDPRKCTYDLDKFSLDAAFDNVSSVFETVPYADTFDVFVKSPLHCAPNSICSLRFNDKLALVSKKNPTIAYNEGDAWGIISVKDYDSSKGYIYVSSADEPSYIKIKRYDQNMNLVDQTQVNKSGIMSYWYNEDFSSGMCLEISDRKLKCILLDSHMRVKVQKTLIYQQEIQAYTTIRLENGGALVFTALSDDPEGDNSVVYVRILDNEGQSSIPYRFQEYICDDFEMNTFRSTEGLHCNYVICSNIVNVRCISPTEYREF